MKGTPAGAQLMGIKATKWLRALKNNDNNHHRDPRNSHSSQLTGWLIYPVFELVDLLQIHRGSFLDGISPAWSKAHSWYVVDILTILMFLFDWVVVIWGLDRYWSCYVPCLGFSSNQNIAKTSSPKCEITQWINHNVELSGKPCLGNEI